MLKYGVAYLILSAFKLLLGFSYHSTDFEVHRNWLAITHSLPIKQWYTEDTSVWTLDYPPLFAWFQLLLSYPAMYFDPKMLIVKNLNYASWNTVLYLRITVLVSDLLLFYGTQECCSYLSAHKIRKSSKWSSRWTNPTTILQFLLLCNVGLIIIDNIHFQYNGFLFGILLLSVAAMLKGQYERSAFYFAVLLNMKHIYLYMAPVYFFYLLRNACFTDDAPGISINKSSFNFQKFQKIGLIVGCIFLLSLGPFIAMGQTNQLISRLFPFRRGLFHSYWAPNIWALYCTLDKVLENLFRHFGYNVPHTTLTRGLTDIAEFAVLPNIPPIITFLLTIIFAAPCLLKLWRFPGNPLHFVRCLVICAMTSFLFGWHVHEKAILMSIIPLAILAVMWEFEARIFFLLSVTGYYSFFPLLPEGNETGIKYLLLIGHLLYVSRILGSLFDDVKVKLKLPLLNYYESLYVFGFFIVTVAVRCTTTLFPGKVFMPMLLTSAYCSVGVVYCWVVYYAHFLTKSEERYKRKLH